MKWLLFVSIPVLILVSVWMYSSSSSVQTVYMYEDRFEPASLTVRAGDTVRFKSEVDRETWPASNFHPSHGIYPEFDPQEPIPAFGAWEFRFDTAGVWDMHDHLDSRMQGTITVSGAFGEAAQNCADTRTGIARASCWQNDFNKLIEEEGFDAAFSEFVKLYEADDSFKSYCHDTMHYVGRAAYDVYKLDNTISDRKETGYCGYGFYHGFIEASLEDEGTAGLNTAKAYCQEIFDREGLNVGDYDSSWAASACWHGVGHAVFDSMEGSLWGDAIRMTTYGIGVCESVFSEPFMRRQCSTGIYNALANAVVNQSYDLDADSVPTDVVCQAQKDEYRDYCYLDLAVGYTNSNNVPLPEALQYALSFSGTSSIAKAIFGVVDDRFRVHPSANPDTGVFLAECLKLPNYAYQEECINGVIIGIFFSSVENVGKNRLLDFCALVPEGELATHCYHRSTELLAMALSEDEYAEMCRQDSVQNRCAPQKR